MSKSNKRYVNISEFVQNQGSEIQTEELLDIFNDTLSSKMHGICFSAYGEGEGPELLTEITEVAIREKMKIVKPYTGWVRIFSCTNGNEIAARVAHEMGIKTMVGAWLGKDKEKNEEEISNLIKVAKEGYANIIAVGNEVLLREDLKEDEIIEYIKRVKEEVPDIPVSYVDAYYIFEENPKIVEYCDVISINCYPFWEYCSLEHSLNYMKDMYRRAGVAAKGRKVIISETGWPSNGNALGGALPSKENAMKYFINTIKWTKEENIEVFYFSAFDEAWKIADEDACGAHWGIWDKHGELKYINDKV